MEWNGFFVWQKIDVVASKRKFVLENLIIFCNLILMILTIKVRICVSFLEFIRLELIEISYFWFLNAVELSLLLDIRSKVFDSMAEWLNFRIY